MIPHFTLGVGLLILASGLGLSRGYAVVILCHLILVVPILAALLHTAAGPVAALLVVGVLWRFDRYRAPQHVNTL